MVTKMLTTYVFLSNLVQNRMYISGRNLNFLDKIHEVEAFSNNLLSLGLKCKRIYEWLKNAHEGKTIALRILANLVQYRMYIL